MYKALSKSAFVAMQQLLGVTSDCHPPFLCNIHVPLCSFIVFYSNYLRAYEFDLIPLSLELDVALETKSSLLCAVKCSRLRDPIARLSLSLSHFTATLKGFKKINAFCSARKELSTDLLFNQRATFSVQGLSFLSQNC